MLNSRSVKLIWSIVLTYPIEQIDGFYIGYRPIVSTMAAPSAGSIITPIDPVDGKSDPTKLNSLPSYTFKTMYDLLRLDNGSEESIHGLKGLSHTHADPTNNNNITSSCEILPDTSSSPLVRKAHKRYSSRSWTQTGNKEQIRCTYEFLVMTLTRKTRYGYEIKLYACALFPFYLFLIFPTKQKIIIFIYCSFIVQAFNSKGAGPTSPEVYAQTLLKGFLN